MEARKITVVDTRLNATKVFESTAETMAQMLNDFLANGIDATGMAIQEGLTKTELNENSILPKDVNYKGVVTNNLVFRITQKEKKIASGMTREEAYANIRELNLQNAVKLAFGKNYTQVPTVDLIDMIEENKPVCKCAKEDKEAFGKSLIKDFAFLMREHDLISSDTLDLISTSLQATEGKNVYSSSELEEMFKNM